MHVPTTHAICNGSHSLPDSHSLALPAGHSTLHNVRITWYCNSARTVGCGASGRKDCFLNKRAWSRLGLARQRYILSTPASGPPRAPYLPPPQADLAHGEHTRETCHMYRAKAAPDPPPRSAPRHTSCPNLGVRGWLGVHGHCVPNAAACPTQSTAHANTSEAQQGSGQTHSALACSPGRGQAPCG